MGMSKISEVMACDIHIPEKYLSPFSGILLFLASYAPRFLLLSN